MAGIQHRGCTSSGSMNVSQDAPQFNTCDEQGYMEPQYMFAWGERGQETFQLIDYVVLPNYTIHA